MAEFDYSGPKASNSIPLSQNSSLPLSVRPEVTSEIPKTDPQHWGERPQSSPASNDLPGELSKTRSLGSQIVSAVENLGSVIQNAMDGIQRGIDIRREENRIEEQRERDRKRGPGMGF